MSGRHFVLFDFDGVIADSFDLAFEVARRFNPDIEDAEFRALFHGNIFDTTGRAEKRFINDGWDDAYVPRVLNETFLVGGISEALETLHDQYTLAIISSTASGIIGDFLTKHALGKYFSDVMGKDVHTSKVEKMRMIFKKYTVGPEACVFITDTVGDVHEAKEHEMGAIAVTWGFHPRATLEQVSPFRIVDAPREIPDAVGEYFARP